MFQMRGRSSVLLKDCMSIEYNQLKPGLFTFLSQNLQTAGKRRLYSRPTCTHCEYCYDEKELLTQHRSLPAPKHPPAHSS